MMVPEAEGWGMERKQATETPKSSLIKHQGNGVIKLTQRIKEMNKTPPEHNYGKPHMNRCPETSHHVSPLKIKSSDLSQHYYR